MAARVRTRLAWQHCVAVCGPSGRDWPWSSDLLTVISRPGARRLGCQLSLGARCLTQLAVAAESTRQDVRSTDRHRRRSLNESERSREFISWFFNFHSFAFCAALSQRALGQRGQLNPTSTKLTPPIEMKRNLHRGRRVCLERNIAVVEWGGESDSSTC